MGGVGRTVTQSGSSRIRLQVGDTSYLSALGAATGLALARGRLASTT